MKLVRMKRLRLTTAKARKAARLHLPATPALFTRDKVAARKPGRNDESGRTSPQHSPQIGIWVPWPD